MLSSNRGWTRTASNGLALLIAVALGIALVRGVHTREEPKVTVGKRDTVYYYRFSTAAEARMLGEALRGIQYFRDQGAVAILARGKASTIVSFVLNNRTWELPDAVYSFGEVGRSIAHTAGGFPLRVRLVDEKLVVRRELIVGKETIGTHHTIYYYGSATAKEAAALGESLRTAGAMKDAGSTVLLTKDDRTTVSFVVQQSPWERPEVLAAFESLMRRVAPSVGGLPLQLRFVDPGGVMHKELSIL